MTDPRRWSDDEDRMGKLLKAARGAPTERVGSRERIWKKVVDAPRPSPLRHLVPAAAVLALGAIAFVLVKPAAEPLPPHDEAFATLALAAGEVQAARNAEAWTTVQVGQRLIDGAQLRTGPSARAYARFASAGALFGEGARAVLTRPELQLAQGSVALSVRHGTGRLRVRAEAYTIEVTGTVFQVKVGAEKVVSVFVHEGTVQVRGPNTDLALKAGESWSSRDGKGTAAMAEGDVGAVRALGFVAQREATLTIQKPAGAEITIDGVAVGAAPLAVLQAVGGHDVVALHQGVKRTTRAVLLETGTEVDVEAAPLPALAPPAEKPQFLAPGMEDEAVPLQQKLRTAKLSAADRDTASYELARVLSRHGRNAEALTLYERLAAGSGPWSEPSLYEVGRLNLRYLANPRAAVTAFGDYRHRFPRGALAPEVGLSLVESQLQAGRPDDALKEMDAFLSAYPTSERLDDVRFVRATVRRDRGDCAGALADYLTLLKHSRHADDAQYFAAYCEQQTGQGDSARARLERYVLEFPAGRHLAEAKAALAK